MPDPVEVLYIEIAAKADKLISDVSDAVDKASNKLEGIGESTQKIEGGFSALGVAVKAAFGIAIVQQFLGIIQKVGTTLLGITQQAVGLAASMQTVNVLFVNLLGSQKKANEFMSAMREQAAITGQNVVDMAMGAKRFLPYAEGNKDAFMNMVRAAQALAAADPFQGMLGAGLALEEFLSGTAASLALRFELPRKKLTEIAKMEGTIEEKMKALNQVLKEHGKGWDLVEAQVDTFSGQLGFIRGLWGEMLLEFGEPVFEELEDALKGVVGWVKENRKEIIATAVKLGELVAAMVGNVKDLIEGWVEIGKQIGITSDHLERLSPLAAITGFQQLGFIITNYVLKAIDDSILGVQVLSETLKRLRRGEGLMSAEEIQGMRQAYTQTRIQTALKMWGLAPKEKAEEGEEEVTEEKEKAPPGLSEEAQKAALKGAKKIEDIIKDFTKGVQKLWRDHTRKLSDIQEKADKDREKALKKAAKSEADASKDYQRDLAKLRRDHNKEKIDEQEDFNKEWKRLIRDQHQEVIDAEWEFQYEEERLIAEGDTLALRDLRIRYQHEKDVRAREQSDARSDMQSDYQERRQDRERDFQEEMQERESQFQEKMGDIQSQLQEELATIAENAAEARTKEQMNYAERYEDLVAARDEKLQAVGEALMSEKDMNIATANEIMALWAEVYDDYALNQVQKGIDADQARKESLGLLEKQALATARALDEVYGEGTASYSYGRMSRARAAAGAPPGRRIGGEVEFAQHGLDAVFSRPTNIVVGEGGVAEHVKVTPLTGGMGGGRMDVNISGNINVTGSALSPEAANALIIKMSESVVEGLARRPE